MTDDLLDDVWCDSLGQQQSHGGVPQIVKPGQRLVEDLADAVPGDLRPGDVLVTGGRSRSCPSPAAKESVRLGVSPSLG